MGERLISLVGYYFLETRDPNQDARPYPDQQESTSLFSKLQGNEAFLIFFKSFNNWIGMVMGSIPAPIDDGHKIRV